MLSLTLDPPLSPREQRLLELGFLASILNQTPVREGIGFAVIERKDYDKVRPASAPSSAVLVRRYGTWTATLLRSIRSSA
jgi:hypothetical protein